MLSRIMGFTRDILIAGYLGAGPVAEAFLVAFSLPNMFRRFFAEGAFNTAFVPMFSKRLETDDAPQRFAQETFAGMAFLLALFTIAGVVAMPALVALMASGFVGDPRFDLAVVYGRLAFPYILFISLAALASGVLNATGRFTAAAAAPLLLNLIFILAIAIGAALARPPSVALGLGLEAPVGLNVGDALALAVPVAGLAQLALVWWAARRAGFSLRLSRPRLTPEMRRLAVVAGPAMLAGGVVQINLLVGRQVASFFEGAIAWLSYADRLYQLPLGVVGIAIGVVLLPDLSRRLGAGDDAGGQDALSRAAEVSMALTIPSAVALVVIPTPLVSVLFGRGAFDADDVAATALALAVYGLGLPAFVMQKVLQPVFFAREDTRTPFRFALIAMLVNAGLAIPLALTIGFLGAAIGTTVAAWVMVALLARGARRFGQVAQFDARCRRRMLRSTVAAAAMGFALWATSVMGAAFLGTPGLRYVALAFLVAIGMISYALAGQALGAFRLSEFRSNLSRSRR